MKKEKLHIYGATGFTMQENNIPPLLYNAQHLETHSDVPTFNMPIQSIENCTDIPPMLPIISKF